MSDTPIRHAIESIGILRTGYPEKFGVPRQPGLVKEAWAEIWLHQNYRKPGVFRGLEGFSHLWVSFLFHKTVDEGWHPTVRPPRLGGNERIGVFASRSPFRPNGLGLSVLRLEKVDEAKGVLGLSGVDMVDGSPVMDVKPYLPWCDAIPEAQSGYAPLPRSVLAMLPVEFSAEAALALSENPRVVGRALGPLLEETLRADPRPAYQTEDISETARVYGLRLGEYNIRWRVSEERIEVMAITR